MGLGRVRRASLQAGPRGEPRGSVGVEMCGDRDEAGAQGSGRGRVLGQERRDLREDKVRYACCWERVAVQARRW